MRPQGVLTLGGFIQGECWLQAPGSRGLTLRENRMAKQANSDKTQVQVQEQERAKEVLFIEALMTLRNRLMKLVFPGVTFKPFLMLPSEGSATGAKVKPFRLDASEHTATKQVVTWIRQNPPMTFERMVRVEGSNELQKEVVRLSTAQSTAVAVVKALAFNWARDIVSDEPSRTNEAYKKVLGELGFVGTRPDIMTPNRVVMDNVSEALKGIDTGLLSLYIDESAKPKRSQTRSEAYSGLSGGQFKASGTVTLTGQQAAALNATLTEKGSTARVKAGESCPVIVRVPLVTVAALGGKEKVEEWLSALICPIHGAECKIKINVEQAQAVQAANEAVEKQATEAAKVAAQGSEPTQASEQA